MKNYNMGEEERILQLIDQCLQGCEYSEIHKDLFIFNVKCLIKLWKERKPTIDYFNDFKNKNYFDNL